jgi:geranylgeranyl pyrophosphate synthase
MSNLKKSLIDYKRVFNPLFLKYIPKSPKTLWQPVLYHFKTGGKRWRPFLVNLIGKIYHLSTSSTQTLEVVVELTHNWTLIHDDIEDKDVFRRGQETVWKKFGVDRAINSGDAMIALSFKILSQEKKWTNDERKVLLIDLAQTIEELCQGQDLEFNFRRKKGNIKISDYMEMVKRKTAVLPKFGILEVAKLGKANKKEIKALEKFCDNLFPAFQIKDDILNLIAKEDYGKEIGGDIKEGKRTIPTIHLLNHASKKEKKEILNILLKKRENTTREEVKKVINLMKKYSSIDFAVAFNKKLIKGAKEVLSFLSEASEKKLLGEITGWLAEERSI